MERFDFRNATSLPADLLTCFVDYTVHDMSEIHPENEEFQTISDALYSMYEDRRNGTYLTFNPENGYEDLSRKLSDEISKYVGHEVTGITYGGPSSDEHSAYINKDGEYFATTYIGLSINKKYMVQREDGGYNYPLLPIADPETDEIIQDPAENEKYVREIPTMELVSSWAFDEGIKQGIAINRRKAA